MEEKQTASQDRSSTNGTRKKISLLVAALLVLAALAGGIWWWHELQVSISTDDAQVSGDIVDISPKIAGRLEKLFVAEGDVVVAGQKLAELDNAQLAVTVAQAQAALELAKVNYTKLPDDVKSAQATADKAQQGLLVAQAQVKSAEFTFTDAKRALDQTEALYAAGANSKEALDTARSRFGAAQAGLDAVRANALSARAGLQDAQAKLESVNNTGADAYLAQLKQAQAAYDNARLTYDNSFINATVGGTVVRVPAQVGENLSSGQTILTVSDLHATRVTANIEENKFGRVRIGQKVDVRVDAYPGRVFAGKVVELGGATQSTFSLIPTQNDSGNFTKVTQRLPVKIEVNKEGFLLKPGMSAVIKIHTV